MSKHSSLSRSPIIASRMSKHYKVVLNKVLFLKKLLCPKAKVLKDNVGEMKAILQSREKERHVKIRANSQHYEVQSNLQNQMHNHNRKNKKFLCRSIIPRKVHQVPLLPLGSNGL